MRRALLVIVGAALGCNAILGHSSPTLFEEDASVEAGAEYFAFDDVSRWAAVDLAPRTGYAGGAFDGRYVYFSPGAGTTYLLRFDTTAAFAASAWEASDLAQKSPDLVGFDGALFDGTHVYLVPSHDALWHGRFVRYDTRQPFTDVSSYEANDLEKTLGPRSRGFQAGAFDGRYAYLTPFIAGAAVRFDTTSAFGTSDGYETFTLTDAYRWSGAAFDGRYVYLVPVGDGDSTAFGGVARYDTTGAFVKGASWRTYDLAAMVDSRAHAFGGAVFDGRYLYFIPSKESLAIRYDTDAPFDAATSWAAMDLAKVDARAGGYSGGTFDGRYVYFVPNVNGVALRYDTQQPFTVPAWKSFDTTSLGPGAKGFSGAVFDGRHVYFVPSSGTTTVRFDARSTPKLPPRASSFF